MATRASKLKAVETTGPVVCEMVPQRPVVTIKRGRSMATISGSSLGETVPRAYRLQHDMRVFEPVLKELKGSILAEVEPMMDGSGTLTVITCGISCKVTMGFEYYIDEADIETLREALGERFDDLVKVKSLFKPEPKLIDLCCFGDTPEEIRSAVKIKSKAPAMVFAQAEGLA
jgi:hypothetical protein